MKTQYVVGFMFNESRTSVALIRKNKPEWQAGLLNGIGGKVEPFDRDVTAAQTREFEEEAGVTAEWKHYGRMSGPDWSVDCFACHGDMQNCVTKTDEPVEFIQLIDFPRWDVIENLGWLIASAVDFLEDGRPSFVEATYP